MNHFFRTTCAMTAASRRCRAARNSAVLGGRQATKVVPSAVRALHGAPEPARDGTGALRLAALSRPWERMVRGSPDVRWRPARPEALLTSQPCPGATASARERFRQSSETQRDIGDMECVGPARGRFASLRLARRAAANSAVVMARVDQANNRPGETSCSKGLEQWIVVFSEHQRIHFPRPARGLRYSRAVRRVTSCSSQPLPPMAPTVGRPVKIPGYRDRSRMRRA